MMTLPWISTSPNPYFITGFRYPARMHQFNGSSLPAAPFQKPFGFKGLYKLGNGSVADIKIGCRIPQAGCPARSLHCLLDSQVRAPAWASGDKASVSSVFECKYTLQLEIINSMCIIQRALNAPSTTIEHTQERIHIQGTSLPRHCLGDGGAPHKITPMPGVHLFLHWTPNSRRQ